MIDNVLTVLKDQLNIGNLRDIVIVDNIAKHDDDTSGLDKVVITLLSVEEESTMKNASRYNQVKVGNTPVRYDLETAPAYLNLYVMIAANRNSYRNALINISKVIEILQTNNVLTYNDSEPEKSFKFRIELHSIPFEQLSYIWGLLGGKVMPSVLYKISVIKIAATADPIKIELINEVNVKSIKVD
ncbi:DUF4255 domain-containing protein [Chryseobacterium sp. ERMR1:04]|uniref:DUF4255 domain-containing protein n=1 Tax=Chryseobacterium sp. ERMR1:04 TaxID=1705393 RepID=UPI0006C8504E|nr:DUF4255 domain-containing protein [Chryseobacterium sp. ERMR1:04]KPH15039.1 hypothetical protein AMQ68_06435 [Chryseobacterium sp. ERMR1:04]